jgi:hypothetical protein
MIKDDPIIKWLLEGDVSIQYQVYRDLFNLGQPHLRERIAMEGWGAQFLSCRNANGHWGRAFYQPKWTSSHYTLLDLKNLYLYPGNEMISSTLNLILKNNKGKDGGITVGDKSDVCINGMFLNYASYFNVNEEELQSIVDFLLSQKMDDGGFNCHSNRVGAVHSSLHTTLSVLEGILEYSGNGYKYRLSDLKKAEQTSREFILEHRLYQSHRTGKIINEKMLALSYPSRWRYDILRCLDYFQSAGVGFDPRMQDAIDILLKKRKPDGTWRLQAKHPGQIHFDMEKTGASSRWNTLRSLRVLKHFGMIERVY